MSELSDADHVSSSSIDVLAASSQDATGMPLLPAELITLIVSHTISIPYAPVRGKKHRRLRRYPGPTFIDRKVVSRLARVSTGFLAHVTHALSKRTSAQAKDLVTVQLREPVAPISRCKDPTPELSATLPKVSADCDEDAWDEWFFSRDAIRYRRYQVRHNVWTEDVSFLKWDTEKLPSYIKRWKDLERKLWDDREKRGEEAWETEDEDSEGAYTEDATVGQHI